jgi:DMSO/TMAO reductase YedYZ heme-binding membrane subunit
MKKKEEEFRQFSYWTRNDLFLLSHIVGALFHYEMSQKIVHFEISMYTILIIFLTYPFFDLESQYSLFFFLV